MSECSSSSTGPLVHVNHFSSSSAVPAQVHAVPYVCRYYTWHASE